MYVHKSAMALHRTDFTFAQYRSVIRPFRLWHRNYIKEMILGLLRFSRRLFLSLSNAKSTLIYTGVKSNSAFPKSRSAMICLLRRFNWVYAELSIHLFIRFCCSCSYQTCILPANRNLHI